MRVALVSFDFGEYCIRLANGLAEYVDVKLVLPSCLVEDYTWMLDDRVDLYAFERPRRRQGIRHLELMRRLCRTIHEFNPDVVHIQGSNVWLSMTMPFLKRYPLICTMHDTHYHIGDSDVRKDPRSIVQFGYRCSDHVIVHAKALVNEVIEGFPIPREKIHVIPHIAIGERPNTKSIEEDPEQILFFGRIWKYKGLEYLVRAEPLISHECPGVKIVVAGTGEDIAAYQRLVVNPDRFIWKNHWIDEDERVRLFQQSSVVVLPYIEATQSGVIPYAYTFAKPVVSTRTGGLPESVDHEETGLLVPPRDEQGLAEAVIRLLKNPQLRKKMGRAGREKLDSEWSAAVVASQTVDVYRQALGLLSISGKKKWDRILIVGNAKPSESNVEH